MWWTHDYRGKVHCHSDDVEIRFEMFLRYFVATILNRSLCDVLPHVPANVCPHPLYDLAANHQFGASSTKPLSVPLQITRRRMSLALSAPHRLTKSTRIPILSP